MQASRIYLCLIFCLLNGSTALAQTNLALTSGTAEAGQPVSLNLALQGAAASNGPAAVQFRLSYAATDFSSITLTGGAATSTANKTLRCSTTTGSTICVVSGINDKKLADGIVATVNATPSTNSSNSSRPIQVTDTLGATLAADPAALSGSGGTVTVTAPPAGPILSSLTCSPASFVTPGTSTCTVSISAAAGASEE